MSVTTREDEQSRYLFIMNFMNEAREVKCPQGHWVNEKSGDQVQENIIAKPYQVLVIKTNK
ncbi:Beta-galactosidase C-terminal domain [Vibrio sp. B1FLJ16]|uniref:Beta-galactosidase C-terminal domain n=1 Tax=Vibrio sp. B1FLJ16 TaxID=2751178 RepID=UPI001FD46D7A|nr:Beta-galactosidase C-terminal domain [Vibrio sp. B1FLJ16]